MFRTKTRKECRKRFVRYIKETDEGNAVRREMLNGLRATKKNYIHRGHGYNQWDSKATRVPARFVETKDYESRWVNEYQCRDANPRPKKGLDLGSWTAKAKGKWLTIKDIQRLKPGDRLEILPLDRNVAETVEASGIAPNKLHPAASFFKANKAIYEHKKDLQGCLTLLSDTEKIVLDPFEFHVEIDKRDEWFPLREGALPAKDPQGFLKLFGQRVSWKSMDLDTHVGYRGPMVAQSTLRTLPPLFWYNA